VIAAIRHERPDYTPHNVFFTNAMLKKMIDHTGDKDYIGTVNNHICKASLTKPQVPLEGAGEHFADEFGVVWDKSGVDKDIGAVAEYKIRNPDQLWEYEPPPVDEGFIRGLCGRLMETKGENFAIASIGFSLFERAWSLCGMEDFLCYMLTAPGAAHRLLSKLERRSLQKARIALEYDIDGVIFGDDWGQQKGMIMGRPLWAEFIKPRLEAMYGEVKSKGKYVLQHSCGDLRGILDELIDIGLDVYQTFQPEIYDIVEYKEKLGGRLTIWGAISTQAHLPFKTPDEIYAIVRRTMEALGEGGGYIAAPTHAMPGDIPIENMIAMLDVFENQVKYGVI
jgi:uroporphyrinogen decarboxylase